MTRALGALIPTVKDLMTWSALMALLLARLG